MNHYPTNQILIPMVIEKTQLGERAYFFFHLLQRLPDHSEITRRHFGLHG